MTGSQDVESFPDLEADIGHNPARFLDRELAGYPDRTRLLKARIAGIDRIAICRAYDAVERNEKVGPTDGPRKGVIELLEEREARLQEIGERPDRLEAGPRRPCDCCDEDDQHSADEVRARRREERERSAGTYRTSGVDTSETSGTTEVSSLDAFGATANDDEVATDGGRSE